MNKRSARKKRHLRIRNKIKGTPNKPRMCVNRSLKNISVQIIDDLAGHTLVSASSLDPEIRDSIENGGNKEAAEKVGKLAAKRALENDIEKVVFDRAGNKFHGRIKTLAEAAREEGLKF